MIRRIREGLAWRWWYLRTPVMHGVVARLPSFLRVFASLRDGAAYIRAILSLKQNQSTESIRVRMLGGASLLCRPGTSDPWVLWDVFANQFQELPPEIHLPRTIVDLGANVGYTVAWYAAHFPAAQIVAVEMDAANFALAQQNLVSFGGRCKVLNAAIWDADGELEYDGIEQQGFRATALNPTQVAINRRRVLSRSLDSLFDEYDLNDVDFVKMDIEGAESAVLGGSLAWLDRVRSLKIEVHPPMTLSECRRVLESHGFACRQDPHHNHCLIAMRASANAGDRNDRATVATDC